MKIVRTVTVERRYGIGTPHRTEAGYRLYDEGAVRALTVIAGLVDADGDLLTAVGGALQDQAPAGCLRLGHEIGAGAALLAATLATQQGPADQIGSHGKWVHPTRASRLNTW